MTDIFYRSVYYSGEKKTAAKEDDDRQKQARN